MNPRNHHEELVIPCLRVVSPETAERLGYVEVTTSIHSVREAHIFQSVQTSLRTCDSVWIEKAGGYFSAGRKKADLLAIEGLVTADQRRNSNKEVKP